MRSPSYWLTTGKSYLMAYLTEKRLIKAEEKETRDIEVIQSTLPDTAPDDGDISLLEERFCQEVAYLGESRVVEAYKEAFPPSESYRIDWVIAECDRLMRKETVYQRIAELRTHNLSALQTTEKYKISLLKKIADETSEKGDYRTTITAIAELNKMQGDYSVMKTSGNIKQVLDETELIEGEAVLEKYEQDY